MLKGKKFNAFALIVEMQRTLFKGTNYNSARQNFC